MSERNMVLTYSSGISHLVERNASFDSGVLRVAYSGKNRNNSFISKQTFERCISSIYNCPVVCNYDRETNSIGEHDRELVRDDDGSVRIVNVTQPVGVVPESARYWWEEIEDVSGVHEYLCTDVLLWKRQEAYQKIKDDGITDESMEITVTDGKMKDGVFVIDNFEFTAFCLLGSAEPCFESASLEMFSRDTFREEFAAMASELKELFSEMQPPTGGRALNNHSEGGEEALEEKMLLVAEYGIDIDSLDFAINDFTVEELREKFESMQRVVAPATEDPKENVDHFALEGQFRDELVNALENGEKVETLFGEMPRYWFCDYDKDLMEVYGYDELDWNLYGFVYSMNGDNVVVDFASKKRMKMSFEPFDEGEQRSAFARAFSFISEETEKREAEWQERFSEATSEVEKMQNELGSLREYKTNAENELRNAARSELLARFESLNGIEAFEALRENSADYSIEELEEKCYAIRGRYGMQEKFSLDQKQPKVLIDKHEDSDGAGSSEPYGGVFAEFGFHKPE